MIDIVYAHEDCAKEQPSIFLAGPSPRIQGDHNWRPRAIDTLQSRGFKGSVLVPLPRDGNWLDDYDAQITWELKYLNRASIIVFWMPRDLERLPAFTSNVEYGIFWKSGKIVLGYPLEADKMRYLHALAEKEDIPIFHTMEETLDCAIMLAK